jgi:superfamily I DNA/RNA helicase
MKRQATLLLRCLSLHEPHVRPANGFADRLASERFTKNLWSDRASAERPFLVNVADDAEQAGYIVEKILETREAGIILKAQPFSFRASHHSASLEVELTRRNIPFVKFGGLKFLEAAHIKECWRSCVGHKTFATAWSDFAWRNCSRASGPAQPRSSSTA